MSMAGSGSSKRQTALTYHSGFDSLPPVFQQRDLSEKDYIASCKAKVVNSIVHVRGDFWQGSHESEKVVLFECVVKE